MKGLMMTAAMLLSALTASAQAVYTSECDDAALSETAAVWVASGTWRQGFSGASPHESVNTVEFYTQYNKNPEQWEALFRWLASTDLLALSAGKHPIEGSTLTASVEDSSNGALSTRQSESHYHHIDFQYVVRGTERFAVIDHLTSTPNSEYKPDVIHYDYDASKALFYDSSTEKFFLFFPCDWHIAKIATDGADQSIRVIVVKIDYID